MAIRHAQPPVAEPGEYCAARCAQGLAAIHLGLAISVCLHGFTECPCALDWQLPKTHRDKGILITKVCCPLVDCIDLSIPVGSPIATSCSTG